AVVLEAYHSYYGTRWLWAEGAPELIFTENDTNEERLFDAPNPTPYVKDAFHAYVIHGQREAVNPAQTGTKAAAYYRLELDPGRSMTLRLRLTDQRPEAAPPSRLPPPGSAPPSPSTINHQP